jgi:hypothetical protein
MKNVRLGKHDYKFDSKTLKLGPMISPTLVFPHSFDFDKGRSPFPLKMWGNDQWGNCVKVAQCNEIERLERLEQRKTLPLTEDDVVAAYKAETGARSPGDPNDTGLVMLDNNRLWRKVGFPFQSRRYTICAFGELDPSDHDQLRAGVFLLHGVQFGFALPRATQDMTDTWDYRGQTGPEWQPGSWGGHAVFTKAYDTSGMQVCSWGQHIHVTNAFIDRYCDEAWAVVDRFDTWSKRPEIDIAAIKKHLHEIGASHIEQ